MSKKAKQHISARVPTERVEVLKASGISVNAFINQVFNELLVNPIFPEDSDKKRESKIKFITKLAILKAERKKLKKLHNGDVQKKMIELLAEKKQWLISSDFVKAFPKDIKNRGRARGLLKLLAKHNKVQMLKNPKRKRGYVFGLPQWKEPTANNFKERV